MLLLLLLLLLMLLLLLLPHAFDLLVPTVQPSQFAGITISAHPCAHSGGGTRRCLFALYTCF
jgi:hypothetical protein